MPAITLWIWSCAYLNCAGWILSAMHQLNTGGYAVALLGWLAGWFVWRKKSSAQLLPPIRWWKIRRRFRKPFPVAFLILTAMVFLGGVLYAPTNYDTLAYRMPRTLHWLEAGQWHWIHTVFGRLNIHSVGIEWLYAPAIALLKTDRFLFLINVVSFLFLPGLVFSVFTRLGVRRRTAWHWMWIVPTGYGYLLQAASMGNDLFGATLVLAGFDCALRARAEKSLPAFFTSLLAMAAATSAKSSNLPLLLPWGIILLPSIPLLLKRPWQTTVVCLMAALASAAPLMVLNKANTGDWNGGMVGEAGIKNGTVLRVGANVTLMTMQNFVPPVFPLAGPWNQAVEKNLPSELADKLSRLIESSGCLFTLPEMQMEENAGLGFGVCVLLVCSVIAAGGRRGGENFFTQPAWRLCVGISLVISWASVMVVCRWPPIGRYLLPYYAVSLPWLLGGNGPERLVRRCWWQVAAYAVFALAALLLILSPPRPLFPVQTVMEKLYAHAPASRWIVRAKNVYSVYHNRSRAFDPVLAILPPDLKLLGMVTYDDPETALWRPFGSRHIEHVCPQDTAENLKARGMQYILVKKDMFGPWFEGGFDDWVKHMNGQVVQNIPLELRATDGVRDWYLVKLN